jgi:SAM-dependent methyltransferase
MRALLARIAALLRRPLESFPDAPDLVLAYRSWAAHPELKREPGGWRYKGHYYPDYLTAGGASHAIFREALKHCKGKGVDVGSGHWPLPGAIALDAARGPGKARSIREFEPASLDYVFSSHCLEHIAAWQEELDLWIAAIKPGGVLFLYLPHPDCGLWQPGSPMVGGEHRWSPAPEGIRAALVFRGMTVVAQDAGPDAMHSFFVCARK